MAVFRSRLSGFDEEIRMAISHGAKAIIIGLLSAVAGVAISVAPVGLYLEEDIGLEALFHVRGALRSSPHVVVIHIDRETIDRLDLPPEIAEWPRSYHARVVRNLVRAGARAIVFDVFFQDARSAEGDQELADAFRIAGNVVLCEALLRDTIPIIQGEEARNRLVAEKLLQPLPLFAESATALAPFPLPKVPVKVSQYWMFKGGRPTLPVVAFQLFSLELYDIFLELLKHASPHLADAPPLLTRDSLRSGGIDKLVSGLRDIFRKEPELAGKMLHALENAKGLKLSLNDAQTRTLRSLIKMYQGPEHRYLNFYGPPGAVDSIPYYKALDWKDRSGAGALLPDLRDKVVFVGVTGKRQVEKPDGFHTVFSQSSGVDISGVEIAATAFANIVEDVHVQPLGAKLRLAIIFVWGLAMGWACYALRAAISAPMMVGASFAYFLFALHRFENHADWSPLVVPLLIQAPLAFFSAVLWRYVDAASERRNMKRAFQFYLPGSVVDRLAKDQSNIRNCSDTVYGACLCTDVERYSAISEIMHPGDLRELLNRYYEAVFQPIAAYEGRVSDIVGDSMMALWTGEKDDAEPRIRACLAALAIDSVVRRFNEASAGFELPTRMGLHAGQMSLGNIGGVNHYEYRPVGDVINTASRIENVNKHLGTRILASSEMLAGLNRFLAREVGAFMVDGKSMPVVLYEILCHIDDADARRTDLCSAFSEGLASYKRRNWDAAVKWLAYSSSLYGKDGPSEFYLNLCRAYRDLPLGAEWDATVRVGKK